MSHEGEVVTVVARAATNCVAPVLVQSPHDVTVLL